MVRLTIGVPGDEWVIASDEDGHAFVARVRRSATSKWGILRFVWISDAMLAEMHTYGDEIEQEIAASLQERVMQEEDQKVLALLFRISEEG